MTATLDLEKAAAFHRATRENYASDLHHMVYADWLEENEEPAVAELIRRATTANRVEMLEATSRDETAWGGFPLLVVHYRRKSRFAPALFRVYRSLGDSQISYVVEIDDAAEAEWVAVALLPDFDEDATLQERVILPAWAD